MMTDSEKLVWAAVFAKTYDLSKRPTEAGEYWEENLVAYAVEQSSIAVKRLRWAEEHITRKEGLMDSETLKMFLDMMGNKS